MSGKEQAASTGTIKTIEGHVMRLSIGPVWSPNIHTHPHFFFLERENEKGMGRYTLKF